MRTPPYEKIEQLDRELVDLTRGSSSIRLALGTLLSELCRRAGHFELGFSSMAAYALERCGRSGRWSSETRTVARRLMSLPTLHGAVASGQISWCMAELVARHATPENEAELCRQALGSTVRAMRQKLSASSPKPEPPREEEPMCSLRVSAGQADIWLFEWTRRMAEHLHDEGPSIEAFVSALLAESHSTLCAVLPSNDLAPLTDGDAEREQALQKEAAWRAQLAIWREESEQRCEANFVKRALENQPEPRLYTPFPKPPVELSLEELDDLIVEVSQRLARRDLKLARLARLFHDSEGWRRLGYSTEEQYARERLGISASSFKAKVALARRLLGCVRRALEEGRIGYEAALLISRVTTVETVAPWVARAERRTVKHLADEVRAAELTATVIEGRAIVEPPSDELMSELQQLEGQVVSGDRDAITESQLSARLSPEVSSATLNLRVTRDTARFFRVLEGIVRPYLPRERSFLGCLCELFWDAWQDHCVSDAKWAHIFARDGCRCANPVCRRRGSQPHHIRFRSQGGTDDDENMLTLCLWCHLEGVHQRRMRITGPASAPKFELGRNPRIVVKKRDRSAA